MKWFACLACVLIYRTDADNALETALRILEALQRARDAQAIAEEAITKAQGQITDIESSLDSVRNFLVFLSARMWMPIGDNSFNMIS